ncbi:PRD domain-containing protein [Faecalicatena orotica]|nr:PRD domain-containing protein [Faecalicatena orotica]
MMKIVQPLNNNVVMAYDRRQGEIVVVGTGVGFHAKKGDLVDEKKIQKIFVAGQNKKLMELIEQVPPEYLELTEEIFEKAKEAYGVCPQDQETLALMDHIHFAVRRLRDGMEFDNPFVTEIRQFYPKEWEIALYAKERIRERFGVEIPDAEVGYIAMHMIASEFQKDRQTVNRTFKVINLSLDYIREHYLQDVKEDSLAYTRMVTHVKYFAQRYMADKETDEEDELLKKTIQETFHEEVSCIEGLSELLYEKFGRHITNAEGNYLVLHLRNCKTIRA